MKTIQVNNNIILIEDLDGKMLPEIELDDKTSLITSSDVVNTFNTQEELVTYIASKEAAKFPPLPDVGEQVEKGVVYSYNGNKAKCLQSHTRMHYAPEETPALFLIITPYQLIRFGNNQREHMTHIKKETEFIFQQQMIRYMKV